MSKLPPIRNLKLSIDWKLYTFQQKAKFKKQRCKYKLNNDLKGIINYELRIKGCSSRTEAGILKSTRTSGGHERPQFKTKIMHKAATKKPVSIIERRNIFTTTTPIFWMHWAPSHCTTCTGFMFQSYISLWGLSNGHWNQEKVNSYKYRTYLFCKIVSL